jgi:hypothetical protein
LGSIRGRRSGGTDCRDLSLGIMVGTFAPARTRHECRSRFSGYGQPIQYRRPAEGHALDRFGAADEVITIVPAAVGSRSIADKNECGRATSAKTPLASSIRAASSGKRGTATRTDRWRAAIGRTPVLGVDQGQYPHRRLRGLSEAISGRQLCRPRAHSPWGVRLGCGRHARSQRPRGRAVVLRERQPGIAASLSGEIPGRRIQIARRDPPQRTPRAALILIAPSVGYPAAATRDAAGPQSTMIPNPGISCDQFRTPSTLRSSTGI